MSEEQKSATPTFNVGTRATLQIPEPEKLDALPGLKARADTLNISYSNNIGEDALRKKIQDHLEGNNTVDNTPDVQQASLSDQETLPLNEVTDKAVLRRRMYEQSMYLVRVRISNLNPAKKDIPGEFITVHNKHLGTVRKYIPFGEATDGGYHVPKIILDAMKERRFTNLKVRRDQTTGASVPEQQWVKEFAIEELEPLSQEELEQLARQQAAARGLAS